MSASPTQTRAHLGRTPAARMLSGGGLVYVPQGAYLRRLQSLYKEEAFRAHARLLYPGLSYILTTTDEAVERLFVNMLAAGSLGEALDGMESLFLSCLNNLQFRGNIGLSYIGIAAWNIAHRRGNKQPLFFADRQANQIKIIRAKYVEKVLEAMSVTKLVGNTVSYVVKQVESAIESSPGGYISKIEQEMDIECKDWVSAFTGLGMAAQTAVGAGVGSKQPDKSTAINLWNGLAAAAVGAIENVVGTSICKTQESSSSGSFDDVQKAQADLIAAGAAFDARAQLWVTQTAGALSSASPEGDYVVPDNNNTIDSWMTGDPSKPPPEPTGDDDGPPSDDDETTPEAGEPTGWATPNPEDDNMSGRSFPPGMHWPFPSGDTPNPEDPGGGGPVCFPNGAVFMPARTLVAFTRMAGMSVTATKSSEQGAPVTTLQISAVKSALQ